MEQQKLPNEIYIGGVTKKKKTLGMTDHRKQFDLTFTGNPLLRSQVQVVDYGTHVYSHDNSIETNWEETKIVDGVVVWKKSGNIPFADMLLDFVLLGAITLGVAHMSTEQKDIEQSASLEHLMVNSEGQICLAAEAFEVSEARAEK